MTDQAVLRELRQRDRMVFGLSALFAVGLGLLFHLTPEPAHLDELRVPLQAIWLYAEHGLFESASVIFLLGAAVVALANLGQAGSGQSRVMLIWLAVLGLLATMRELDMHILMNPEYLNAAGVRFRIDWWLDLEAPLLPKLAWLAIFAALGMLVMLPLVGYRRQTFEFLRNIRDPSVQMLVLTGVLMMVGFTFDDLLRGATFICESVKATLEEGAEALGALSFLLATIGCATVPISRRQATA